MRLMSKGSHCEYSDPASRLARNPACQWSIVSKARWFHCPRTDSSRHVRASNAAGLLANGKAAFLPPHQLPQRIAWVLWIGTMGVWVMEHLCPSAYNAEMAEARRTELSISKSR
jgi:hypothetical protein